MEAYDLEGSRNEERIRKLKEKIVDIDPDREYTLAEVITGDPGLRNYLEKQKLYAGIDVIAQLNEAILQLGGSLEDIIDLTREGAGAKILEFPKKKETFYSDKEDSISLYFQQAYHKVLTRKEEVKAGKRIYEARKNLKHLGNAIKKQKGKRNLTLKREYESAKKEFIEAKNYLVNNNLMLVIPYAKKYYSPNLPLLDRIQEGNTGVIIAAERFDYRKKNKFSTYAVWWIRQAILRAISESNEIRIPLQAYCNIKRVEKSMGELRGNLEGEPSIKEVSENTEFTEEKVKNIFLHMKTRTTSSLQDKLSDGETEMGDLIENENSENAELETTKANLNETIIKTLKKLRPRDEEVIKMRFGIGYDREYTLKEIGKHFGVTRERIRQIEDRTIKRLRQNKWHRTALEQFTT